MVARIPLIPDITTNRSNLRGIAQFLKKHGVSACSLMPYNPMWQDKAVKNGIDVKYSRLEFMSKREEENCVQHFLSE
jgi:pyruvate-formate lyase-activating enzyme